MNNNYRLQLRHGDEAKNFVTRNDVFRHINGQLQYGGVSLLPYEPVLFYYGEEDNKNAIIMVGLPEGDTHKGKSYFIIDTADLKEQINSIDGKYDTAIKALQEEDGKLWNVINKEVEDRISADETEAQLRSEKDAELEKTLADEVEARTKADESLQSAIDHTKADLMSVVEACGLIYNDKLAEDRVSYEPDTHDEIIRDANDIADAVDKISKFAQKMAKDLNIKVANTDTVKLNLEADERIGGGTITADVKIAGTEGLSKKTYDNNIIGKTAEGVYASVSLEPSTTNPNKLIFTTSGYVNGVFQVDAFETEVDLTAYKGDNGKTTGVTVNVDTTENKISAQLNLSSSNNNILKLEDGEYSVEGTSKNITYKDGTVFSELNKQSNRIEEIEEAIDFVKAVDVKPSETDTVSVTVDKSLKGDFVVGANVKLSSDKSIIISNGGLKADVSASFKKGTSTLFITVGNNEYAIDLSDLAVSVLKSAQYDASTEELVLEFIVGETTKTLRIPVGSLIHDVEVDDTDTVDMTIRSVSGGPNHISAEVKVDKTHSDNILTITSNGLYVAKAYITEAVKDEATERKEADNELKSKLAEVSQLANDNKDAIKNEATTARAAEKANADAIAQEVKDARAAEKVNADAIAENKAAIKANETAIDAEEGRAKAAEQANATAITAEETRAMAAEAKNATAIDAEITRATEKEADLLEKIGANTEKITETKTAIASEVDRATKAEKAVEDKANANDLAIKAESERAKLAEQANATAVTNEVSRATTAESVLTENVNAVKVIAENAKSVADAAKAELTDEITRAKAAEEANATAIAKEISDARAAEAEVRQDLTNSINVEKARAEHAESDLAEKIAKNTTDIASITTEVGNIELKKEGELSYALYVNGTKHGEFTIPKDQFLKSVTYDPTTKDLVFVFDTTSGETTTRISIADLVNTYEAGEGLVLNGNVFSVDLTKVATVDSVNAAIHTENIRALAAEQANATAIAKEISDARAAEAKVQSDLESALATEKERAIAAEGINKIEISKVDTKVENTKTELNLALAEKLNVTDAQNVYATKTALEEVKDTTAKTVDVEAKLSNKLNIVDAQNVYATKTALEEVKDTTAKTVDVEAKLANKLNIVDAQNVYATKTALEEVKDTTAKTVDVEEKLSNKLNVVDAQNVYATKEEVQNVKDNYATTEALGEINSQLSSRIENNKESLDHIDFRFNNTTSELIYTDKNGNEHPFKLYGASLVKEGHFDAATNSIVLTIENSGVESYITIPVSELLSDLSGKIEVNAKAIEAINTELTTLAKKWDVNSSSSVELTKTNDTLTAKVLIASGTRQALQLNESGLFVSKDLQDLTCVYGEEGTVSGQDAISKLLATINTLKSTIDTLAPLKEQVDVLLSEVSKIKSVTAYDTYTNAKNMSTRLDSLETTLDNEVDEIKNNLIGPKDGSVEGSVWNELNNMVDAGTF